MIYNSNPYKRKMESMQVNVAPSVPNHTDKPTTEQVMAQETIPDPVQPIEQSVPPIEITPYVPEVEGVEVPAISLEDIEPSNPVIEEVAVNSGELSNPEQAEGVESVPKESKADIKARKKAEQLAAKELKKQKLLQFTTSIALSPTGRKQYIRETRLPHLMKAKLLLSESILRKRVSLLTEKRLNNDTSRTVRETTPASRRKILPLPRSVI